MSLQDVGSFNPEAVEGNAAQTRCKPPSKIASKATSDVPPKMSSEARACDREAPAETAFQQLVEALRHLVEPGVHFTASLAGEDTQFVRFNQSKVRQTGHVRDGQVSITLIAEKGEETSSSYQTSGLTLPFTGDFAADWAIAMPALSTLQAELAYLPTDPYAVLPTSQTECSATDGQAAVRSRNLGMGNLLPTEALVDTLLKPVKALDFSGLYAAGNAYRAYADSAGKQHWFETPSFTLDYSLFGSRSNQAAKGTLAGQHWHDQLYTDNIATTAKKLALLSRPVKAIPKGRYRTYLAPAAVADLMDTVVWGGGLGEAALRQGNSAFSKLEQGEARLSEKFSLQEDFERIAVPRFNSMGDVSSAQLPIIQNGRWVSALVNRRSAKEYGKASNGASAEEAMQAPTVAPGTLNEADILAKLGIGLYLSNLHYLNWSDLSAGRITGMTRYACFWVENGEIVAPIENLRFDDDLYRFLGEGLIDLTCQQTYLPTVGTYDRRSLGGMWMPGMLIDQFRYTL